MRIILTKSTTLARSIDASAVFDNTSRGRGANAIDDKVVCSINDWTYTGVTGASAQVAVDALIKTIIADYLSAVRLKNSSPTLLAQAGWILLDQAPPLLDVLKPDWRGFWEKAEEQTPAEVGGNVKPRHDCMTAHPQCDVFCIQEGAS